METGGTMPAGSGRNNLRLDPFALPVRYPAVDAGADGQMRQVEIHRERVILRRAVEGMRMAVGLPVTAYRGVALQILPPRDEGPAAVSITLAHRDQALSLPLFVSSEGAEVNAIWKAWSRVLGLPLLLAGDDGALCEPFGRIGAVETDDPLPRRRRRSSLKRRRPAFLARRKPGSLAAEVRIHRNEREIIARD